MLNILLASHTKHLINLNKQRICLVGKLKGETALGLIHGRSALLLVNPKKQLKEDRLTYAFGNYWLAHGVKPVLFDLDCMECQASILPALFFRNDWCGKNSLISYGGFRIIILRDNRFYHYHPKEPKMTDMLILTGEMAVRSLDLVRGIKPGLIILDSSVGEYKTTQWMGELDKLGIKYHSVTRQGAYVLDM